LVTTREANCPAISNGWGVFIFPGSKALDGRGGGALPAAVEEKTILPWEQVRLKNTLKNQ
jgi:hypothetical protein